MEPLRITRYTLAGLCLIFLVSCTTTAGSFCQIARPLRPSAAEIAVMSDVQVREVLALNRKGQELCGWKP